MWSGIGAFVDGIEIIYADINYLESFHRTLNFVAQERVYIEMIEAPSVGEVRAFQESLISINAPVFYALDGNQVIGWCDVLPINSPRQNHRAQLGMGLLPDYRGRGIGSQLLDHAIKHSKKIGLEKIELYVYTRNTPAIALYRKFGFHEEGTIEKYRKLDNEYFDCLLMSQFL